jgi:hypothetical protein
MPPGFRFPDDIDVWQRLAWDLRQHSRAPHFMEGGRRCRERPTNAEVTGIWVFSNAQTLVADWRMLIA